jgi:cytochrome P450
VPRFYFDLREGEELALDEVGLECDSLEVAEHEAIQAASEVCRYRLLNFPQTQAEAVVEPNRLIDDFGRKTEAAVQI